MADQRCALTFGGTHLELLPEKAVFWPEERALILADLHLGKDLSFRAAGILVPEGTNAEDLARIDALLQRTRAERLLILGDLVHSRRGWSEALAQQLRVKLERWTCEVDVVLGNHDQGLRTALAELPMRLHAETLQIGPLAFAHDPEATRSAPTLAGHWHPVVRLSSGRDRLRLPCFLARGDALILPAFGSFTGGLEIGPQRGDRVYVTTGEQVIAV